MSTPQLDAVTLHDAPERPLLILGPSLGTSAQTLWAACAARLPFHVVAWELPGHGGSAAPDGPFTVADLARSVLELAGDRRFAYAGDSIGGAVGLQLLLDAADRVEAAVLLCTAAKIGDPDLWRQRAALVRAEGTTVLVDSSAQRWFAPGFAGRDPVTAAALLEHLARTGRAGYAGACEALAAFDVRDRLAGITAPVLAVAGAHDQVVPVADLAHLATTVRHGRLAVLPDVAHLAPAECPAMVAELITGHLTSPGMAVRRAVLGDVHVDRAVAATTAFTADFQDFLTRYAWGEIWTRPGLDRRSRSLITLTALVALGHHDELALHVRAARTNGLSVAEIKELLLQTAVYCGVPAANAAFRVAQRVLDEIEPEGDRR